MNTILRRLIAIAVAITLDRYRVYRAAEKIERLNPIEDQWQP